MTCRDAGGRRVSVERSVPKLSKTRFLVRRFTQEGRGLRPRPQIPNRNLNSTGMYQQSSKRPCKSSCCCQWVCAQHVPDGNDESDVNNEQGPCREQKKRKEKRKIGWNLGFSGGGESRVMYGWNFDFKLWNLKFGSVTTNTYRSVGAGRKQVTG